MNKWISVNDSQPKKMESTLLYTNFGIWTIVFQQENLEVVSGEKKLAVKRLGSRCRFQNCQRRSDTWQHPRSVVVADRH